MRNNSLYVTLAIIIVSIITIVTFISTTYIYFLVKERLVEEVEAHTTQTLASMSKTVSNLVSSYSENEYINLIRSELEHRHSFAIIVKDDNLAKILDVESYYNGMIRTNSGDIVDFDQESAIHQQILKRAFYSDSQLLVNKAGQKIGRLSLYITDSYIEEELQEFVLYAISNAIVVAMLLVIFLFVTIRKYILTPILNIQEVMSDTDDDGLPIEPVKEKGSIEINTLASKINEMVSRVKKSRDELLDSHEELKIREELLSLLEAAINAAYDGIVITDQKGTVLWVNPAFEKLTGYKENEVINKNMNVLQSGIQDKNFYSKLWGTIQSGKTWYGQIRNRKKGGEVYLEEESITPVSVQGETKNYVAIKRDITAQQQKELQLQRSQRMYSLGKLTGGIAHDYNNMLGVIIGYCELLEMTLNENKEVKEYLDAILHAAERGSKLTRKLLSFTRREPSEAMITDVNTVLTEFRPMLEKMLTVRIGLEFHLEENIWQVFIDADDLEDSLLNMSINAMHAMPDGGMLKFKTSNQVLSKTDADILGLPEGEYVKIAITDTGCGMDENITKHIFDPFFSTKKEMGTGLGLSQVYSFIERAKGTITVDSIVDKGSTFELHLPRYQYEDDIVSEETTENFEKAVTGSARILVVDDEEMLLKLSKEILSAAGYNVVCANSGKQALSILKGDGQFDLVVSDVLMPGMDGFELAKIIKDTYPSLKIMFASGYSETGNTKLTEELKNIKMLKKPFSRDQLLEVVHEILA